MKLVCLLFVAFLCILLINEYTKILENYKSVDSLLSWLSKAPTEHSGKLQTTTAFPVYRKNLYMKFTGRFGNVLFEFTAAYGLTFSAGIQKMFFQKYGQTERFKTFFPKTKNLINEIGAIPPGLQHIKELDWNMYDPKTTREVAESVKDVYINAFLGKFDSRPWGG